MSNVRDFETMMLEQVAPDCVLRASPWPFTPRQGVRGAKLLIDQRNEAPARRPGLFHVCRAHVCRP
jgi:hypothetical protein